MITSYATLSANLTAAYPVQTRVKQNFFECLPVTL